MKERSSQPHNKRKVSVSGNNYECRDRLSASRCRRLNNSNARSCSNRSRRTERPIERPRYRPTKLLRSERNRSVGMRNRCLRRLRPGRRFRRNRARK